nr:hypothetical protein [Tanacetum cinerariifolium]
GVREDGQATGAGGRAAHAYHPHGREGVGAIQVYLPQAVVEGAGPGGQLRIAEGVGVGLGGGALRGHLGEAGLRHAVVGRVAGAAHAGPGAAGAGYTLKERQARVGGGPDVEVALHALAGAVAAEGGAGGAHHGGEAGGCAAAGRREHEAQAPEGFGGAGQGAGHG